jgi:hypothetical protein
VINLLSRPSGRAPFPELDPEHLERFDARLRLVLDLHSHDVPLRHSIVSKITGSRGRFETALEELESSPSLPGLESLLGEIDVARGRLGSARRTPEECVSAAFSSSSAAPIGSPELRSRGGLVCYWPGRSIETGEAEVASRGYFDARDRPPLLGWLTAIARPHADRSRDFEVAVLAWVPPADLEHARRGVRACASGALAWLEEVSKPLSLQLGAAEESGRDDSGTRP